MQVQQADLKVKNNSGFQNVLTYLFAFFLILSVNSVYYRTSHGQYIITAFILILAVIMSFQSISKMLKESMSIKNLLISYFAYIIMTSILFVAQLYKPFGLSVTTALLILVFPLLILPYVYCEKKSGYTAFFSKFKNIVLFLSVLSLLFWFISMLGKQPNMTKIVMWGGVHPVNGFWGLDFIGQASKIDFLGFKFVRNTGLFVEGPMYSFILSLALIIHLFVEKGTKIFDWQNVLLVITILSTASTTGLIVLLFAVFIRINRRLKGWWKVLLFALIPILIYMVIVILKMKMNNASSDDMTSSFNVRMNDIYAGFMAWKDAPFWGNGLYNPGAIKSYMDPVRLFWWGNNGFSSGVMEMLALGGIYYFIGWLLLPLIRFSWKNMNHFYIAILFLIIMFVTLSESTFLYIFIILYFLI